MKRIGLLMAAWLTMTVANVKAEDKKAANADGVKSIRHEKTLTDAEAQKMVSRLHEIKTIASTSKLNSDQKREYRKEVKAIRDQFKTQEGFTLYLSLTAILIIILLILLL